MAKIVAVLSSLHLSVEFEIIFRISAILLFILHTFRKCVSNLFTDNRFIIVFKRSHSLILQ